MGANRFGGRGVVAALAGALALAAGAATASADDSLDAAAVHATAFARTQVTATDAAMPAGTYPQVALRSGWTTTDATQWTAGFLPGSLWELYQATGDVSLAAEADAREATLASATDRTSSDLGFVLMPSIGNAFRLLSRPADRAALIAGAQDLATRYDPVVGAIRSRDGGGPPHFKVVVDTLMSIELLYAGAADGGDPAWKDEATSHALKALENNVRADGSVVQLVDYDPAIGAVQALENPQGYSLDSTWARGEGWALAGLTSAYGYSHDARLLAGARRVADHTLAHLPADGVPYWDYADPAIPSAPRDTSAAAVAASGLYELARLDPDATRRATYAGAADHILGSLTSSAYLAEGSRFQSVLLHSTHQYRFGTRDVGTAYTDYYFLQALLRRRLLPPSGSALSIAGTLASNGQSGAPAVDGSLKTRWQAKGDGQWLRLDLGTPQTMHRVSIAWFKGDVQSYRFDVQTSLDGTTWTSAASAASAGSTRDLETYDVPPVSARYVRIVGHGSSTGPKTTIAEVQVR